jgi:hypothetical protein
MMRMASTSGLINDQVGIDRKERTRPCVRSFPSVTLAGHASEGFEHLVQFSASSKLSLAIHRRISKISLLASEEIR